MSKPSRSRPEPTAHVDLEYPSSVPTFTVNPVNLSSSSTPLPWFSAFGRKDANAPLPSEVDPKYSDPAYYASSSTYGKNGRNTSHTAKKPEGHIKRPPNCFLLFRSHVKESGIRIPDALKPILKDRLREKRRETKAKKSGRRLSLENDDDEEDDDDEDDNDEDEQSVSKISGILWDFLPAAEKSFFRARAAHAKAQHKKLYPNYKYSPQVKDKTVKRRVGKKMPTEKRERLEEVATVLVREMGWATGDEITVKRSATPSSVKPHHTSLPQDQGPSVNVPGTGAFGVAGYEHHNPYPSHPKYHPHPQSASQYTGSPFGDIPYPQPSMERRTSSCPPPNAHMTWADASATQTHTPPATSYGGMYPPPPPMPQPQAWTYPAPTATYPIPPAPVGYTVVRPGGKTVRKMRTGPGSAKAQVLNGKGSSPASSSGGGKKLPVKAATVDGGAMTLPSLHTALKAPEVPMSTGTGYDQHAQDAHWGLGGQGYVSRKPIPQSSPATFSSSAPPSVLLETPPFTNPQLQHYSVQQATFDPASAAPMYDYSGQQGYTAQYDAYGQQPQQPYYAPYQATAPVPAKENEQSGELGLTIIDTNYTFPPPSESPRSGSPPKAPSQRERDRTKWARQHLHSPIGAVKQRSGASAPKPGRTSPTRRTPPLLSPTPITPISSQNLQGQHEQSLEDLGVDLDLSHHTGPRGEMDPGMLEFHFAPGSEMYGALDGYNVLAGPNGGNLLLGDVALGMHDDGSHSHQQHSYTAQFVDAAGPESSLGPLDVPLDALYGGADVVQEPFDPSSYITEDAGADLNAAAAVDELKMTSTQQLEYEMMEWRRGSGGERRASVQLGMTLGNDVGVALYGFDAASTPSTASHSYETNPAYGHAEFDFHNADAVAPFTVPANYGMYNLQPQTGQQGLGTVMEERERASSEEADDPARKYHRSAGPGSSWVASPA